MPNPSVVQWSTVYSCTHIDKRWEEDAANVKLYSIMGDVFLLFKIKIV